MRKMLNIILAAIIFNSVFAGPGETYNNGYWKNVDFWNMIVEMYQRDSVYIDDIKNLEHYSYRGLVVINDYETNMLNLKDPVAYDLYDGFPYTLEEINRDEGLEVIDSYKVTDDPMIGWIIKFTDAATIKGSVYTLKMTVSPGGKVITRFYPQVNGKTTMFISFSDKYIDNFITVISPTL